MPGDSTQRNPFSSSATRPGALPFYFPAGVAARQLIDQLAGQGWWGQIVGPHGSGKTTLLANLAAPLEHAGRRVLWCTLQRGQRQLPRAFYDWARGTGAAGRGACPAGREDTAQQKLRPARSAIAKCPTSPHPATTRDAPTQVIVDGYEQLSYWQRLRLKRACRRRHAGLLVTSHTSVGLPPLYQTDSSLALAEALAATLTSGYGVRITREDIRRSYEQHGPNLREVFFALYDVYESRKRG
jgi:hypothetical protein